MDRTGMRIARIIGVLTLLAWVLLAGVIPAQAAGPDAVFFEAVENLTEVTPSRISRWAAQGTAVAGSPFCPSELIAKLKEWRLVSGDPKSCTVTAFGSDEISLAGTGKLNVPDFATVINGDNTVDAPEFVVMTGTITGDLVVVPFAGPFGVIPDLNSKKAALGPVVPLIRVINGLFTPSFGEASCLEGTFRLPFRVTRAGQADRPVRGKPAFYLGDDGSLIKVQPEEFAFGFPMLRAEATRVPCP